MARARFEAPLWRPAPALMHQPVVIRGGAHSLAEAVPCAVSSLLAATTLLVAGCGDDDNPTGPPPDVVGSYDLITVNGEPLPQDLMLQGSTVTFISGNVNLEADGTCSNRLEVLIQDEGQEPEEDNTVYECTYVVSGNSVTTTDLVDGFTNVAIWSGDGLTWNFPGATLLFER